MMELTGSSRYGENKNALRYNFILNSSPRNHSKPLNVWHVKVANTLGTTYVICSCVGPMPGGYENAAATLGSGSAGEP
jgi:hypothetical protein